jgi:hypothetical protein
MFAQYSTSRVSNFCTVGFAGRRTILNLMLQIPAGDDAALDYIGIAPRMPRNAVRCRKAGGPPSAACVDSITTNSLLQMYTHHVGVVELVVDNN